MNKSKLDKLKDIIKLSAFFNVVDLANILSELMTEKEKKDYVPMICHKSIYREFKTYVVVAEKYLSDEEKMYGDLVPETWVHNMFNSGSYFGIYHSDIENEDVQNKDVTYGLGSESIFIPTSHGYINKFMDYLFALQLSNNGKRLTYEEMQVALNDFLELEKDKPKQKIKKPNNK